MTEDKGQRKIQRPRAYTYRRQKTMAKKTTKTIDMSTILDNYIPERFEIQ
jgi:hypothetical protein